MGIRVSLSAEDVDPSSLETKAAESGTTQRKSVPDALPHRTTCDTWPLSANFPKNIRG